MNLELKTGDFIKALDEDYVYQIQGKSPLSIGETYMTRSIGYGHSRSFKVSATHYRKATEDEVKDELEKAPKYFSFWVANKKDVIISNGQIFASTLEKAREIFNKKLIKMNNVGEYFISEEPLSFIEDYNA